MGGNCCGINTVQNDSQKRLQYFQKLHQKQNKMLHLIFSDLSSRICERAINLQNFLLFFRKNGIWGECLFKQFDIKEKNLIQQKQFIEGMIKFFKVGEQKRVQLLFKFFTQHGLKKSTQYHSLSTESSVDTQQGVSFDNFLIMLYNYPKQDLKQILNDKIFFQEQLKKSLKLIGSNRRLQSVYNMGHFLKDKQNKQLKFQQRASGSQIQDGNQDSMVSMVGRDILKNVKTDEKNSTILKINDGQKQIQIITNNFHYLVKKFAKKMFKDMGIDLNREKMNKQQFKVWIQQHKQLYKTYYDGFHKQIWEYDDKICLPAYMISKHDKKSQAKYVKFHTSERGILNQKIVLILIKATIIVTENQNQSEAIQVICLEGLMANKYFDQTKGFGIQLSHRDGIYKKRYFYFRNQQLCDQWFEELKFFKGQTIEQLYTLTKKIGVGKFSVVYEAIQKSTGNRYAVKVIESYKLSYAEKSLLAHQTSIMQVLSHPFIVHFRQCIQTKSHLYIITQLCPGTDLFQFIKEFGPLEQFHAAKIIQQIIVGLRYIHSLGIIHRDLKPQNIMISCFQDQVDKIKIIDFGFANYLKILQQQLPEQSIAGTPNYLAPQILQGDITSFKADIFALGSILYFLLSGDLPFNDLTLTKIFSRTMKGDYNFCGKIWSTITVQAKDIIDKFLKTNPQQRISLEQALQHPWFNIATKKKHRQKIIKNRGSRDKIIQVA